MPDDTTNVANATSANEASTDQSSELEQLFEEAERPSPTLPTTSETSGIPIAGDDPQAEAINRHIAVCGHDMFMPHQRFFCKQCGVMLCPRCASAIDGKYCVECMRSVDIAVTNEVVTDDDGVAHNGRRLAPTPAFATIRWSPSEGKTTAKTLSEMSRTELEEFIGEYQSAVREAEKALDFRRIRLSSAQLELDERRDSERRKLRADKTKYAVKTVTVGKDGKQVKRAASTADLTKMMQMLDALTKLRAKPKS